MNSNKHNSRVVRNTPFDPITTFLPRSNSLDDKIENVRRANVELNASLDLMREASAKLDKVGRKRFDRANAKPFPIDVVFPTDLPIRQSEIDNQKIPSQFKQGKVTVLGYTKKNYVSNIPSPAPPTRMSGSGLKVVDKKRNIEQQGDGIRRPSNPLPVSTRDVQPPKIEIDVYRLWVLAGKPNTLDMWATEQGYWFKNAKERKAYYAIHKTFDPVSLRIMRGDLESELYDLAGLDQPKEKESLWASATPFDTLDQIDEEEFSDDSEPEKSKSLIREEVVRQETKQGDDKLGAKWTSYTAPVEEIKFCPKPAPGTLGKPITLIATGMRYETQSGSECQREPAEETWRNDFSTHLELTYRIRREIVRSMTSSMMCKCQQCRKNYVKNAIILEQQMIANGMNDMHIQMFAAGKDMANQIADAIPDFKKTMESVRTLCDKLNTAVSDMTKKATSAIGASEKWANFFLNSGEILALGFKIASYVSKISAGRWGELTITFLLDIATSISYAIKTANMMEKEEQLKSENALLRSRLDIITRLMQEDKLDIEAIKNTASYKTQGIGSLMTHPLFTMLSSAGGSLHLMRNFNTIVSAIKNGKCIIDKLVEYIPKCILEFLGLATDMVLYADDDYEDFSKQAYVIIQTFVTDPLKITDYPKETIEKLHARALEFQKRAAMALKRSSVSTSLPYIIKQLADMLAIYDDREQLTFQRLNPFAILLCGEPRTGKSEVARKIANNIHDWLDDERLKNVDALQRMGKNKSTYCYQSHLSYMDGYMKQGILICDELGARNDGEDLDNFFSMVSSNTFVCPMASMNNPIIGKKGTTFTSHTVIACSNKEDFSHLNAVYHTPEAINQRFIFRIDVSALPGVARRADFGHLRFRIVNYNTDVEYTLPQLLYILKEHQHGFVNFFLARSNINYGVTQLAPVDLNFACNDPTKADFGYKTKYRIQGGFGDVIDVESMTYAALLTYAACESIDSSVLAVQYLWHRRPGHASWYNLINVYGRAVRNLLALAGVAFIWYKSITYRVENVQLGYDNWVLSECNEILRAQISYLRSTEDGRRVLHHAENLIQSRSGKDIGERKIQRLPYYIQSLKSLQTKNSSLEFISSLMQRPECECILKELQDFKDHIAKIPVDEVQTIEIVPKRVPPTASSLSYIQGGPDQNALQVEEKMVHYMLYLRLKVPDDVYCICAIPLNHVSFVVPKHFLIYAEGEWEFEIVWYGGDRRQWVKKSEVNIVELEQDAMIMSVPTLKWRFPNLLRNFIDEKELVLLTDHPASLVSVNNVGKTNVARIYKTKVTTLTSSLEYFEPTDIYGERPIEVVSGFTYEAATCTGDCGSPIILHNNNLRGKIVGIHVAGSYARQSGIGILLTRQLLESHIPTPHSYIERIPTLIGRFVTMGKMERGTHVNRKTAFERTDFDKAPVPKVPSDLSWYDGEDKIFASMLKNAVERASGQIDNRTISRVLDHLESKFPPIRDTKILSWEESIGGYEEMDGINLKTSPGWPYVATTRKSDYIIKKPNGEYEVTDATILEDCKRIEKQSNKEPPEVFWVSSGKDELLKPGKECRIFEIAPMHFTILGRRYFGAFLNWVQANPGKFYSMIGINPESFAWKDMYDQLVKTSTHGYAWDWKKYDATIKNYLMEAFIDLINRWYDDEHSQIRRNIGHALMVRPTVYGKDLLLIADGNPSGHFMTSVSNSYIQVIIIMSYWLDRAPPLHNDLIFFDHLTRLVVYGDDSVIAIKKEASWFQFEDFANYVSKIGMELQLDTKETGDTGVRPIHELTFLKREFVEDYRGTIVPKLNWNSMISMLNWNRVSKYSTRQETYKTNCRVFSQFLYFYGRSFYNSIKKDFGLDIPTWQYYDELFYQGIPFPIQY